MIAIVALLAAPSVQANELWDRLWLNADQRGEALLRQGDAADAARTFTDPRRKAFAESQAGDHAAAARALAGLDAPDALYNRGNALARSGQLKEALQAYDQALARDPADADVRRNRALVAKALDQAAPPPPPPPPPSPSASGASPNHGGASAPGATASQPGGGAAQGSAASAPSSAASQGTGQRDARRPATSASAGSDDASQARRDVQAGLDHAASAAASDAGRSDGGRQARSTPGDAAPRTEGQLSEQQWLRRIPDDPGGLLRRKFMIEHLMRQQEGQR